MMNEDRVICNVKFIQNSHTFNPGSIYNVTYKEIGIDGTVETGDWQIQHPCGYVATLDATTRETCFNVIHKN